MHVLGLNPDGGYFKVALLAQSKGRVKIHLLQEYRKEGIDLQKLKKEILEEAGLLGAFFSVASMLSPDAVLVRELFLPLKRKGAVLKALPFQLEGMLPPSERKVLTIPFIRREAKGFSILLYNMTEESMERHLEEVSSLGFDSDFVTTTGDALRRFASVFVSGHKSLCVVHFGWENSFVVCIKGDKVVHNVTLNIGFRHLIHAIKLDSSSLEGIDFSLIRREVEGCDPEGSVAEVVISVQKQILRVLEFLKRKELMESVEGIVFTGYADIIKLIMEKLDTFTTPIIQPTPHLEYDRYQITSYAVELGIALESLERKKGDTGLRVGRFTPKKVYKEFSKQCRIYLALLFVWGALGFLGSEWFFLKKEKKIHARFNEIVRLGGEKEVMFPITEKEVALLVKKFEGKKLLDALITAPPVCAFYLDWILERVNGEIPISHIHYALEKYPSTEHPNEKYLVRITLSTEEKSKEKVEALFHKIGENSKGLIEEKKLYENKNGFEMDLLFKGEAL